VEIDNYKAGADSSKI